MTLRRQYGGRAFHRRRLALMAVSVSASMAAALATSTGAVAGASVNRLTAGTAPASVKQGDSVNGVEVPDTVL